MFNKFRISVFNSSAVHDVRPLNLSASGGIDEAQSLLPPVHSLETGQQSAPDEHEDMEHVIEPDG